MNAWKDIARNFTLVAQLGLTLLMPLLMCLGLCWLVTSRLGVGSWVYIIGFFFGMGGSFMSAYKFYLAEVKKNEKKDGKHKINFNSHL